MHGAQVPSRGHARPPRRSEWIRRAIMAVGRGEKARRCVRAPQLPAARQMSVISAMGFVTGYCSAASSPLVNSALGDSVGGREGVAGLRARRAALPCAPELLDPRPTSARAGLGLRALCISLMPVRAPRVPDVPEPTAAQERPPKRKRGADNNARAGTHAHTRTCRGGHILCCVDNT
jgi:hypothetical protein